MGSNSVEERILAPSTHVPTVFRMALVAIAAAVAVPFSMPEAAQAQSACELYRITGYVRGHFNPWTYDGTSVWTREPIAAASWNLPINSRVSVQGLGSFRIADRGGRLGLRHIDILVDTVQQARSITGWRSVCVLEIGKGRTPFVRKPPAPQPPTNRGVPLPVGPTTTTPR